MRVAFDNEIFIQQEYGGISRYVCELASHLNRIAGVESRIFAPLHRNEYLEHLPQAIKGSTTKIPFIKRTHRVITMLSTSLASVKLQQFAPDVFHRTYYGNQMQPPASALRVLTVHDMIHERFPDMFPDTDESTATKRRAVESSDHIICVSKKTRDDLVEIFGLDQKKTSIVYHGFDCDAVKAAGPSAGKTVSLGRPYLLYVGSRVGYKNFDRFLQAYAASKYLKSEFAVICFGGGPLGRLELQTISGLCLSQEQVTHVSGSDTRLYELYSGASLFIYPSLYEGFGIPLLEAMALGCPVVCGDQGSMPEVAAGAARLFDAIDVDSIRMAIEETMNSPAATAELRARGLARSREFSWSRCANETLQVYRGERAS